MATGCYRRPIGDLRDMLPKLNDWKGISVIRFQESVMVDFVIYVANVVRRAVVVIVACYGPTYRLLIPTVHYAIHFQ